MGCTDSKAATAVQQPQKPPTELKEVKKPPQPPPPPPAQPQTVPTTTTTNDAKPSSTSEKKALSLTPPNKDLLSIKTNDDEEIKKILEKSGNVTELDDVPKNAANQPRYSQEAYLALPKVQNILKDNITTKEKLIELFSVLDDDADGLLSEVEVDDIIYLVKTSYEEKKSAANRASVRGMEDGPIMSEGIQIDFKNPKIGVAATQHHVSKEEQSPKLRPVSGFEYSPPPNHSETFTGSNLQLNDGHVKGPPRRPPTKFLTPQTASPKKLSHITLNAGAAGATPATDFKSPRSNIMSDFDDEPPVQPINSPHTHPADVSLLSVSFSGSINGDDVSTTSSAAKLRKSRSYVDEREFIGPPPASKKGFLMTSPMKENLYHVLDTGILYCIDSNAKSPKSFSLDRKGINLKGRRLIVHSDNLLELTASSTPTTTSGGEDDDGTVIKDDQKVEIRPRNEREKQGWIKAIEEHLLFLEKQEQFKQLQDQEEEEQT